MNSTCPICGDSDLVDILCRPHVPQFQNRLHRTAQEARIAAVGRLDLVACRSCHFVWNRAFEPDRHIYDAAYENDQTFSLAFSDHIDAMVHRVLSAIPEDEPIDAVEVGCGQGVFLRRLATLAGPRLRSATGFDPAWRGEDGAAEGVIRFFRSYYGIETAARLTRAANVVITRHTIEHVPDPLGFLHAIRITLDPTRRPRVYVETPCISWILRTGSLQDLFYEHCSLFTARGLGLALSRAGFGRHVVGNVFGEQYLWAEAELEGGGSENLAPVADQPMPLEPIELDGFIERWREHLGGVRRPVALWGAGAKGATFGLMIDPGARLVDCVVDINPAKQGCYLPVTGHSIVAPREAAARGVKTILIMNPNYAVEIAQQCKDAGFSPDQMILE